MRRTRELNANARAAFGLYDGLFWGETLVETQARDLRTLARVFDVDAASEAPLADLWRTIRPLLARPEGRSVDVGQ